MCRAFIGDSFFINRRGEEADSRGFRRLASFANDPHDGKPFTVGFART